MRSDFINKRELQRRRTTQTQNFVDGEVIVIPEFDTMFLHEPPSIATQTIERWRDGASVNSVPSELNLDVHSSFNLMPEMAIALLNPWDDGHDRPDNSGSPFAQQTRPRTPTRIAMAFNLSALPTNAQITDAKLNLTITNKRDWD
jgi:hypothetical protein